MIARHLLRLLVVGVAFNLYLPANAQDVPGGEGSEIYKSICGACHGPDRVLGMQRDKQGWQDTIDSMKDRGASGSADDFAEILKYLVTHFGPPPSQAANIASPASSAAQRLYVVTHVDLTPPNIASAAKLLNDFAAEARRDPGAVRYEVMVEPDRRNHIAIVSVWESRELFEKHLALEHTKLFREKLQPMLGGPLDERWHVLLQ
ncbi:MAG: antibiotic biosynthesis monooxygenase [Acidobacteriota bacterium]